MGFFDKLKSAVNEGLNQARKYTDPFTEKGYLEAAIAAGFLIGGADGDFDADEREGMVAMIKQDPTLSAFDDDAISAAYTKIEALFKITLPLGRKKALKVMGAVTDAGQREALMEFACVIATLNGVVDDDERAQLDNIANAINVAVDEDLLEV